MEQLTISEVDTHEEICAEFNKVLRRLDAVEKRITALENPRPTVKELKDAIGAKKAKGAKK
jgi:hypothetical protein